VPTLALGFPPEFFTVLFAIPRATGYLAHWRESLTDPDVKIMRPQQIYEGVWLRSYPSINVRQPAVGLYAFINPDDPQLASAWFHQPLSLSREKLISEFDLTCKLYRYTASSDSMWQVAPSNASRRRLAGGSTDVEAHSGGGGAGGGGGGGGGGSSEHFHESGLSPAFSAGVTVGDATSGIDKLLLP
jgi:citrate synthase